MPEEHRLGHPIWHAGCGGTLVKIGVTYGSEDYPEVPLYMCEECRDLQLQPETSWGDEVEMMLGNEEYLESFA